jgi:hypothetical protein
MKQKHTKRLFGVEREEIATSVSFGLNPLHPRELPLQLATPNNTPSRGVHTSVNIGRQQVTVDILTHAMTAPR